MHRMTKLRNPLLVMVFLTAVSLTGLCQAPTGTQKAKPVSPFADYAGDWTGTFEGKVWLQLKLELNGEKLSGSLVHARDLQLNDNGELKSVSEEQSTETVSSTVVNPDGLMLTVKDPDSQDTVQFLMCLVLPAKDAANLKMVGEDMPPGVPKPKPWKVTKAR